MSIWRAILVFFMIYSTAWGTDLPRIAELKTPSGPGDRTILSAAFSPDGRTIATGHQDNRVRLWDASTAELIKELPGQHHYVEAIAYSPDGKLIATGGYMSKMLVIFDAATGGLVLNAVGNPDRAVAVAFSPDGKKVVCGGGGGVVRMWNVALLERAGEFKGDGGWDLAFSPDGKSLASVGSKCIHFFSAESQQEVGRLEIPPGVNGRISFSADGRMLGMACNAGVMIWELASGKPRRIFEQPREARGALMGPGGRFAATVSRDRIYLLDLHSGHDVAELIAGEGGWVYAMAFSPDGKTLVCGGSRMNGSIWDLSKLDAGIQKRKLDAPAIARLWEDLASNDATRAFDAVLGLGGGDPEAMKVLREKIEGVLHPDGKKLDELVAKLDSEQFIERETAAGELVKLGSITEGALRRALEKNPSPQLRAAIENVQARSKQNASAQDLRLLRAIEAIEMAGTKEVLKDLADQWPAGKLREVAEETMKRMK